jgi:hypothetical protein
VCGAAYLIPVVVLLPAPACASGGTKLAIPGMSNVGEIVGMGMISDV